MPPPRVEDDAALPKTDAAGRPFADDHQAARYALSRDALKAREARRAAESIEVDAVEERAPDAAYELDETPRVYLMVDDRGKAAKLMALLNDEQTCKAYFPGLTHAGAVCAPRAPSEKRAKGCRRTAWVALRNASLGAVRSAIDHSPAPIETHLVQRALCGVAVGAFGVGEGSDMQYLQVIVLAVLYGTYAAIKFKHVLYLPIAVVQAGGAFGFFLAARRRQKG